MPDPLSFDLADLGPEFAARGTTGPRITVDPQTVEQDLARLVLGLMEFLRQILELRAIERLDRGTLTPEQEETLGAALMRAEEAIRGMAGKFGLRPEDLSLDLGPLGRTI